MHPSLLRDIGISFIAATALAYVARLVRQPLLLAYLLAGVLIGPLGFRQVTDPASIQPLAELGLTFLMLIVGLEIDVRKLLAASKSAAIVTLVQVLGSALLGWVVAMQMGYAGLPAVYLGGVIAFSSTMIVVKLLTDRGEIDTLPGRMTLAILLLQDVFAIVALAIQPNLGRGLPVGTLLLAAGKGMGLIAAALVMSWLVLPALFRRAARSPELLLLTTVAWCFFVCGAADAMGFSPAMGALIAGVSIAGLPYTGDVVAKICSLRDFFVTLFFVSLGMLLTAPTPTTVLHAVILSVIVVVSRFALIWPTMRLLGHDNRLGILSSLHLSQISEFSLLVVLLGVTSELNHITADFVSLVVITLIITSTVSTYLIQFSHSIARLLTRGVAATPLRDRHTASVNDVHARADAEIVLVGCFRIGTSMIPALNESGCDFAVIDFNPELHAALRERGIRCVYGDISHFDTLEQAGIENAKVMISSIPDDFLRGTDNRRLLETLRRLSPSAKIVVIAESIREALSLYDAGADHVLLPRVLTADRAMEVVEDALAGRLADRRTVHIEDLTQRLADEPE